MGKGSVLAFRNLAVNYGFRSNANSLRRERGRVKGVGPRKQAQAFSATAIPVGTQ